MIWQMALPINHKPGYCWFMASHSHCLIKNYTHNGLNMYVKPDICSKRDWILDIHKILKNDQMRNSISLIKGLYTGNHSLDACILSKTDMLHNTIFFLNCEFLHDVE